MKNLRSFLYRHMIPIINQLSLDKERINMSLEKKWYKSNWRLATSFCSPGVCKRGKASLGWVHKG